MNICSRCNKQTTFLSALCMYFGSQYCKEYRPRSDCSNKEQTDRSGSSLIRVHGVCFHGKCFLECIRIYAADAIFRVHGVCFHG